MTARDMTYEHMIIGTGSYRFHAHMSTESIKPEDRAMCQEQVLAWVLAYGDTAIGKLLDSSVYSGSETAPGSYAYALYWKGLLDRRIDLSSLSAEFRINQAGLDLLKEDL